MMARRANDNPNCWSSKSDRNEVANLGIEFLCFYLFVKIVIDSSCMAHETVK